MRINKMTLSTPKIEKIFNDINEKALLEANISPDKLFKEKVENLKNQITKMKKMIIIFSNIYLIITFTSIFLFYITILDKKYILACFNSIWFIMCLYNFLDTYFIIRLYSNEIKIHNKMDKEKK